MAGTLTISTLSDGTNSTSATNPIRGSARAWVNYNGSAQTIRSSFNVSSVTYNGTGNYTVNFTTAMPNANYAIVTGTDVTQTYSGETTAIESITTSSFVIKHAEAGSFYNATTVMASIFSS